MGKDIQSLLVFNFAAVRDVIVIVPQTDEALAGWSQEEKEAGIVFNETADGVWVCPHGSINQFPDTFSHLKAELLRHFNKEKFQFSRRETA